MIAAPETEIRHGTKIGRFVVTGELGEGAMGVVYSAHDRELDRQVALKVLRSAAATDEDRMRMLREGQAMARVTHPNVITVFEVGVSGSIVFLAQELLDGGTLGRWLEREHTQAEIVDKFIAAGRGLAAAHAVGLVHRDFKPDNVLLGKDGRLRVADFGLARALGAGDERRPATASTVPGGSEGIRSSHEQRDPMSRLTRTGVAMGTPIFMAPEQHKGERVDERCDQFAFCVALYHALYGDWPFAGKTTVALADAVIEGKLQKPPRGHRVSAPLRRILVRGLCANPQERYPTMDALLADLGRRPRRKRVVLAGAVGVLTAIALALAGGYVLKSRDERVSPVRVAPTFDPKRLSPDRSTAWLSQAIERGQLDDALEKYDMAAALQEQNGARAQASIARSAGALVLALRGHFDQARKHLGEASATKGISPIASAYADLAAAAVAYGAGDLGTASTLSDACSEAFASPEPELSAMCLEVAGDTAAERGDLATARNAYARGLSLAKRIPSAQRALSLELALAALDFDAGLYDSVVKKATELQAAAAERGATSSEHRAWVLLARTYLAQAASQQALEALEHIKVAIEPMRIRLEHRMALGQTYALLGDPDEGAKHLEQARKEAERAGALGLTLAARLARLDVDLATGTGDSTASQTQLIADAKRAGFGRLAQLAETAGDR